MACVIYEHIRCRQRIKADQMSAIERAWRDQLVPEEEEVEVRRGGRLSEGHEDDLKSPR